MIDFVVFISTQFFNFFLWLDDLKIVGSLSFLRVLVIIILFYFGLKFLKGGKHD